MSARDSWKRRHLVTTWLDLAAASPIFIRVDNISTPLHPPDLLYLIRRMSARKTRTSDGLVRPVRFQDSNLRMTWGRFLTRWQWVFRYWLRTSRKVTANHRWWRLLIRVMQTALSSSWPTFNSIFGYFVNLSTRSDPSVLVCQQRIISARNFHLEHVAAIQNQAPLEAANLFRQVIHSPLEHPAAGMAKNIWSSAARDYSRSVPHASYCFRFMTDMYPFTGSVNISPILHYPHLRRTSLACFIKCPPEKGIHSRPQAWFTNLHLRRASFADSTTPPFKITAILHHLNLRRTSFTYFNKYPPAKWCQEVVNESRTGLMYTQLPNEGGRRACRSAGFLHDSPLHVYTLG